MNVLLFLKNNFLLFRKNGLFDYFIIYSLFLAKNSNIINYLFFIFNLFISINIIFLIDYYSIKKYKKRNILLIIYIILEFFSDYLNKFLLKIILFSLLFIFLKSKLLRINLGSLIILTDILIIPLFNYKKLSYENVIINPYKFIIDLLYFHIFLFYEFKYFISPKDKNKYEYFFNLFFCLIILYRHIKYEINIKIINLLIFITKSFFQKNTLLIIIYWIIILGLYFFLDIIYFSKLDLKLIIKRKFFHFLSFLIYIPGIYFIQKEIFKCIIVIVLYVFIMFEFIKKFPGLKNTNIIILISKYLRNNIDKRDDQNFIITHIFLLSGISSSLFYNFNNNLYNYLGILVLGIGDSFCSIFGMFFGRTKIYPPTNRTLEGSLGGYLITIIMFSLIKNDFINIKEIILFILIFLYEGFTLEIDNFVLPIFSNLLFDLIYN